MTSISFEAVLGLHGKTATGIVVPPDVVEKLGTSKRPPVVVKIGKYSYRSTVASMRGQFLIPVSAENRNGAGINAGDAIKVTLTLDDKPREVDVPADFAKAMKDAKVRDVFDKLAFTHRKEHVRAIEDAKTETTRLRRIDKAIEKLSS
jgi:bifunctional DNA-binding transcriptional regulator/antitoxin component of YhaV-PrlF toxin-antitoxin module